MSNNSLIMHFCITKKNHLLAINTIKININICFVGFVNGICTEQVGQKTASVTQGNKIMYILFFSNLMYAFMADPTKAVLQVIGFPLFILLIPKCGHSRAAVFLFVMKSMTESGLEIILQLF